MTEEIYTAIAENLSLQGIVPFEVTILNQSVRIENGQIIVNVPKIENARTYFDTIRAIINFVKYRPLDTLSIDDEIWDQLSFPPIKFINTISGILKNTLFDDFYRYGSVNIDKKIQDEIFKYIKISNDFLNRPGEEDRVDKKFYYRLLKWFTFSLDELKHTKYNGNKYLLISPDTLFIRFYTIFEMVTESDLKLDENGIIKKSKKGVTIHLSGVELTKIIEKYTNYSYSDIESLKKIREDIVHRGLIFRKDWLPQMILLIDVCHEAINGAFQLKAENQMDYLIKRDSK